MSEAQISPIEGPRERLLAQGPRALSDAELIALLINTGRTPPGEAVALAQALLDELDGPPGLARASVDSLLRLKGIGPVRAARLRACVELIRRVGPIEASADPFEQHLERLRGQVPTGERAILGFRPEQPEAPPITLDLGAELTGTTRCGALLARILAVDPNARWWIVAVRPRGRTKSAERAAARRLDGAAELLGLRLDRVLLLAGDEAVSLSAR